VIVRLHLSDAILRVFSSQNASTQMLLRLIVYLFRLVKPLYGKMLSLLLLGFILKIGYDLKIEYKIGIKQHI
jgi:hypothetical protein